MDKPRIYTKEECLAEFNRLSESKRQALCTWIGAAIQSARSFDRNHTSYGLKHEFERVGFYVDNEQFKGAMLCMGYSPRNAGEQNWVFPIKPRTPWWLRKRANQEFSSRYTLLHLTAERRKRFDDEVTRVWQEEGDTESAQVIQGKLQADRLSA